MLRKIIKLKSQSQMKKKKETEIENLKKTIISLNKNICLEKFRKKIISISSPKNISTKKKQMFITYINTNKKERINSEKKNNYKSPLSLYENNIISTNIFNFDFSEIKKNIRNLENSIKTFSFKNFIPTKKNNNVYFKIKDNFQEKKNR